MFKTFGKKTLLVQFARLKVLKSRWNYQVLNPDFDGDSKSSTRENTEEDDD